MRTPAPRGAGRIARRCSRVTRAGTRRSLYIFAPDNQFRKACLAVVEQPLYDWFMCGLVIYACCIVAYGGVPGSLNEGEEIFVAISNVSRRLLVNLSARV